MNNFNINKTFGLVFIAVVLALFVLTFVFLVGHRVGSNTVKSEVLWSRRDFSDVKTREEQAEDETFKGIRDEVPEGYYPFWYSMRDKDEISPISQPKMILFRHVTSGKWATEFEPTLFLEVVNTELNRCFIDGRLRISLNGEIYWIRLETEDGFIDKEINYLKKKIDYLERMITLTSNSLLDVKYECYGRLETLEELSNVEND